MVRKLSMLLCVLLCLAATSSVTVSAAVAESAYPELSHVSSITVHYLHGEDAISDVPVSLYYVAQWNSQYKFEFCGDFKDCSVEINKIRTAEEWDAVAETLRYYTAAYAIEPMAEDKSGSDGTALFSELDTGVYLAVTAQVRDGDTVLIYKPALVSVPGQNTRGEWEYDIDVYPKHSEYTPSMGEITLRAEKQWLGDYSSIRPDSIEIAVAHNGVVEYRETLSEVNNWSFVWSCIDDGGEWSVVESGVPAGYSAKVERLDNTFVITNSYNDRSSNPPQTGDDSNLEMWAVTMSAAGLGLILIAVYGKRRNEA